MILKILLATSLLSPGYTDYIEKPHEVKPSTQSNADSVYLGSVYFRYNSARLNPEGLRQAAYLSDQYRLQCRNACNATVRVIGFADNSGRSDHNLKLGLERAQETARMLERLGVNMDNARVASYGDSRSISRSQQFRRAEVWLEKTGPGILNIAPLSNGTDKTVLYMALFAIFFLVVAALGILLVVILKPRYRNDKFY